jgi:hypothetical protein
LVRESKSGNQFQAAEAKGAAASLEAEIFQAKRTIETLEVQLAETEAKLTTSLEAAETLRREFTSKESAFLDAHQNLQFEFEQNKISQAQTLAELQESNEQQEQVSYFFCFLAICFIEPSFHLFLLLLLLLLACFEGAPEC